MKANVALYLLDVKIFANKFALSTVDDNMAVLSLQLVSFATKWPINELLLV